MDNDFLSEAEEHIEALSQGLMRYEEAFKSKTKINPEILNGIFRAAHTLKGLGGVFGYQEISHLAHAMENLLAKMRLGQIFVDQNILDILFEGIEKLEEILKAQSPGRIMIEAIVQKINKVIEGKAQDAKPVCPATETFIPEEIRKALGEYEEHRLAENLRAANLSIVLLAATFKLETFDTALPKLTNWLKKQGEVIATMPVGKQESVQTISF